MLVVSANRNKVIRVTVYLASEENDQILRLLKMPLARSRKIWFNIAINPLGSASAAQDPDRKVGVLACLDYEESNCLY